MSTARLRWILATLLSHWRRRPLPLIALLGGLALATALWSGVQGLNAQARQSYAEAAATLGGPGTFRILRPDGVALDEAWFGRLRRAGWPVSPVVEGRLRIGDTTVQLIGVEPLTAPRGGRVPVGAQQGAALLGAQARTLAAPDTLESLGLTEGDRLPGEAAQALPPLAPLPGLLPATLIADIGAAQVALGLAGRLSHLVAPAELAQGEADLAALAGEVLVLERADDGADLSRLTDSFHLNLTAFGLLAFAVGLFIVHGAVGLAFEQRVGMLRTLRACGASQRELAVAMVLELVAFALLAGAVGMVLGYLIAGALLPDVAATLRGLYGAPVPGSLTLAPGWWLSGMAMSLGGALLAAGDALLKGWRLPVLAPAMPAAWAAAHASRLRWQTGVGIAALMLAAMVARAGQDVVAGFVAMGALMLGAALLLPRALDTVLRFAARRANGPVLGWIFADGRQALGGLSLALMALMLALAANIGVSTMVGSFRGTFTGWLDQRLAAEIYVRTQSEEAATAFEAIAPGIDGITAVLPSLSAEVQLGGFPAEVLGLVDHPTYRRAWPLIDSLPEPWALIEAGQGALVSEQLARRLRLRPGSALTLPGHARPWPVEVAGIYPDYGNPQGQVVVNREAHAAYFPQARRGSWGVRVAEGETAAVMARLRDNPRLAGLDLIDQEGIKTLSLSIFERTFAVTGALNALTFGVAGVALLTSLTTLAAMRLSQLAPLWAMGLTRRELARIELGRTVGLAALTALCALPLGVALAWLLLAVVNVQAFGWRLPMALFPLDWLWLMALALVAAALAAAWPAFSLARMAPARLVQVFAQDR